MARLQLREIRGVNATGIGAVAVVQLVARLVAGDAQFFSIDHNDIIAGVDVGRELGLVLAAQAVRQRGCEPPEHLSGRVYEIPGARDFVRLGGKRFHQCDPALKAIWGNREFYWKSASCVKPPGRIGAVRHGGTGVY
ncbi:hypothetical protein D3C83_39020 [compost metagenome]